MHNKTEMEGIWGKTGGDRGGDQTKKQQQVGQVEAKQMETGPR